MTRTIETPGTSPRNGRVLSAMVLLLIAEFGKRLVSYRRLRGILHPVIGPERQQSVSQASGERIATSVKTADRYLPGARTCLARSLVTEALLLRHDHSPRHRIGVARTEHGGIAAHSWIECGDTILIGDKEDLDQYRPLEPMDDKA